MKYIAVFCSVYKLEEKYVAPAKEFARLLAKNGYNLIWGGTNEGLKVQLQKMKDEGFIKQPLDDLIYFADTPQEAIQYLNEKLA